MVYNYKTQALTFLTGEQCRSTGLLKSNGIYISEQMKLDGCRDGFERNMSETSTIGEAASVTVKNLQSEKYASTHHKSNGQSLEKNLDEDDDEITAADLAPDGGWGWLIALAMIVVFVSATGASPSFTIVFGEFFEATGQAGSAMTILNSIFMISFSLSSLMTTAMLKRYPMRMVGITAAVLYSVPNILLAFVTQVWQMASIFFVQGFGLGVMNNICNSNFNAYWVKKRAKVMSATQVIVGLGGIVYPILIEKLMTLYGYRGTAALVGVVSLHCIIGMMMMHPVEWHARDPDEVRKERARLAEESRMLLSERLQEKPNVGKFVHPVLAKRRSTIHVAQVFARPSRWSSLRSLKEGGAREVPLLVETLRVRVGSNSDVENGIRLRTRSGTNRASFSKRMSGMSASSIGNIAGVGSTFAEVPHRFDKRARKVEEVKEVEEREESTNPVEKKPTGLLSSLSQLFELSLLKDRAFMSTNLGISFVFVSDSTFASLLPLVMMNLGYTTSDAALTITVAAAAELVSRIFLAIFTLFVDARPKFLFFMAMISMSFAKIGFFYFDHTLAGVLVSIAAIGVVRSWMFVPQPLVVVENFPVEKYSAAYGIFSLVSGGIMIFFGPVIGFIKDWTNSFSICQLVLIVLNSIFILPWGMEFLTVDKRKRIRMKELEPIGDVKEKEKLECRTTDQ